MEPDEVTLNEIAIQREELLSAVEVGGRFRIPAPSEASQREAVEQETGIEREGKRKLLTPRGPVSQGMDEINSEWFKCQSCNENRILRPFTFCPNCGIRLAWPIAPE